MVSNLIFNFSNLKAIEPILIQIAEHTTIGKIRLQKIVKVITIKF